MSLVQFITPTAIFQTRNIRTTLFDWISEIAGVMEAIDATSWAEIACIDEEYEGEGFKLKIID